MIRTLIAAAILVHTAAAAQAGTSIPVNFADLNLSNKGDIQVLAGRIHVAAEAVCGAPLHLPGASGFFYRAEQQICVDRISRKAIRQAEAMSINSARFARK